MFSNRRQDGCSLAELEAVKFPVTEIPYAFQLDHVSTLFVKVSTAVESREFKKLRRLLQRERHIEIELCVMISVLRFFHVRYVV